MAVCLPQHGLYCSVIVRMESIWCREKRPHTIFVSRRVHLLCHRTVSHTLLLWPHFSLDTSLLPLTATLLSNLSQSSSYLKVSGSLTCTQRRERTQLKQMGSADSCTEDEKVNQFEMGVQKWTWQASVIKSKAYGKEKCSRNLIESNVIILGGN